MEHVPSAFPHALRVVAIAATTLLGPPAAAGQSPAPASSGAETWAGASQASSAVCEPGWVPTFGGQPGVGGAPRALAAFDDGDGPVLYVGGGFSTVAGIPANGLAKWDGSSWSVDVGGLAGTIRAFLVFDDGGGPALYAGGSLSLGGSLYRVAKWDGSSWTGLVGGPNNSGPTGDVYALAVFDDGSGPALYAGGQFTSAGSTPAASRIAKWDGASWSALGEGLSNTVHALQAYDDGSGPALYAGGTFGLAGGLPASRIARWDGSSWSDVGGGTSGSVYSLAVFDDGGGEALFVGGGFSSAGGLSVNRIARWDGAWSPVGGGMGTSAGVRALRVHDDGGGPALFAAGGFTLASGAPGSGIARWNGASWSALGSGLGVWSGGAEALGSFDEGNGPVLYAGGILSEAGGEPANGIARWDGADWSSLGSGLASTVHALTAFDDGSGEALYAGGSMRISGVPEARGIARWDGSSWSPLASGINGSVRALLGDEGPEGPRLFVTGSFVNVGGQTMNRIAVWDGTDWSPLGSGLSGTGLALAFFDDGDGEALYAAGQFLLAGDVWVNRIAKWDGAVWSPLGSGIGSGSQDEVLALAVFETAGRPALYAAGKFTVAGGLSANRIAKWDGESWSDLGAGLDHFAYSLVVFDSGNGPSLYVGGAFSNAGGWPAYRIARWSGSSWHALGGFLPTVVTHDLAVFDDGNGPALYAAAIQSGSGVREGVWRWDGGFWHGLGADVTSTVFALGFFDDGGGAALFAGGQYGASAAGDSFLAKHELCVPGLGLGFCYGEPGACPCGNAGGSGEGCANSTGAGAAIAATGSAGAAADDLGISAAGLLPGQPALLFAGEQALGGGAGLLFGDGLRCAGGNVVRLGVRAPDAGGGASWGPGLASEAGYSAGQTARFQVWYRDVAGSPCGSDFNLSHGLEIAFDA